MSLLSDAERDQVRASLAAMSAPVRLVFFTQSLGCESCGPTRRILDEIVPLNEHLSIEEYNLVLDGEKAAEYAIDRVPAIAVVSGGEDTGIRFFGAPSGYEFVSLIEAIVLASSKDSHLTEASRSLIASVTGPVHLQVFVTPT